jgi:hypothetical protein
MAVEGWGPFRARPTVKVETVVPAAGTKEAGARRYLGELSPWRRAEGVAAAVLALAGAAGVGVCWNGASREVAFRDQIGWTIGAFLSLALFVLAGVLWLMAGFRQVRHGIHELQSDMNMVFRLEDVQGVVSRPAEEESSGLDLVVAPGMHRAHRPDCMLARGKQVRALTPAERSSYPPCGLCMQG